MLKFKPIYLGFTILLTFLLQSLDGIAGTINGLVKNVSGQRLRGVSIYLKNEGTDFKSSTTTDETGAFSFHNVPVGKDYTLTLSYVGYQSLVKQGLTVANEGVNTLSIVMEEQQTQLDDVVVIGYGKQKRSDVTAAVASFRPTEQTARPVLGPDQLIQGRMAGVQVSAGSGSPGSSNRVSIRGIGSLSAANEPLYVIDGVPVVTRGASLTSLGEDVNPLALLNPSDIESVEVLKDAASAAIYGSRATNGVIIITTKTGKSGQSRFAVDAFTGFSSVPRKNKMKMANPEQYLTVINEAIDNYNIQYGYVPGTKNYMLRKENPFPGETGTDWFDLVSRTANTSSGAVSFSSGTDKTKVFISGNYLRQEGTLIKQKFEKVTGKLNLTHKLYNWLEVGMNSNYSYTTNNRVPGSNSGATVMSRSIPQRPYDMPYKPNGDYYKGGTDELIYHNPLQIINEENVELTNYRFLGTFFATANLAKGLTFKTLLGTDLTYTVDEVYYNDKHPYGLGMGLKYDDRRFTPNTLWENTLNYDNRFGKLSVNGLLGYSYQQANYSTTTIKGQGFPSSSFQELNVASLITEAGTSKTESSIVSVFSRAALTWDDKYMLNLTMRADGSSKFAPENRWGYFPSVSAGWNMSKETFWEVDMLKPKLRVSYGETGNQDGISSYAYQAQMGGGQNYNNTSGINVTSNGNRSLTWETAQQYGAGLDVDFWNGRLNLTVDYFLKNTNNLLYSKPMPATSGFTTIMSNIGSMRNKGWEFALSGNTDLGPVKWSSDFNISFIRNKLTSLMGEEALLIGANRTLQVGQEVGAFYMYKMLGIYQNRDEIGQSFYDQGVRPGDVQYEDLDGNGKIDVSDRQIIGSSNPKFFGGFNNNFNYKNFDFNIFFTYSVGNDVYASYRTFTERLGNNFMNMTVSAMEERWTGEGTSNTTPRAIYGTGWNTQNSSRFLEDGSYLRLRALNLGYTLSDTFAKKLGLQRLRVYVQGDNLYLWTKYKGFDPEVTSDFDPQFIGQDNLILPQPRTINFGFNLGI